MASDLTGSLVGLVSVMPKNVNKMNDIDSSSGKEALNFLRRVHQQMYQK